MSPRRRWHGPRHGARHGARALRPESAPAAVDYARLLAALRQADGPITLPALCRALGLDSDLEPAVRRQMATLERHGAVFEQRRGRWALHARSRLLTGRLVRPQETFGFVVPDEGGGEDLFISGRRLSGARHGDRVLARVIGSGRARAGSASSEGEVVAVLERRPPFVLGLYRGNAQEGVLIPRDERIASEVLLSDGAPDSKLQDGALVWAEIIVPGSRSQPARGRPLEVLGSPENAAAQERAVVRLFDLDASFSDEALREARRAADLSRVTEGREDFTADTVVTIDPPDAKDHDDAVGLREPRHTAGSSLELMVHIADVAHFVPEGGAIDLEARRRATSVYFPGRCLPMLPEALSADLCSLVPGQPRLVQSVVMRFNAAGEQTSCRFTDGVIRSAARLAYDDVSEMLAGREGTHAALLRRMDALARQMRARRMRRGSLDLDLPGLKVEVDAHGRPTDVHPESTGASHQLIEEFMLAANEAVARFLSERMVPAIYRIHEDPEPEAIDEVERTLAVMGHPVPRTRGSAAARIRSLLAAFRDRLEAPAVSMLILRALKLARYSEEPQGHFGLAAPIYTHFTSPIRRYPDLAVHRALRRHRQGGAPARSGEESNQLALLADECSRLERRAEEAERTITDWKVALYMKDRIGSEHSGMVTGMTPNHLFVTLDQLGVEGAVRLEAESPRSARGSKRTFRSSQRASHDASRGARRSPWRLGDRMTVRVSGVDLLRGRVQLSPSSPSR